MKSLLSVLFSLSVMCGLSGCSSSKDYRVTLVVTGDAPSVTINSTIVVTSLPWWNEYHTTVYADEYTETETLTAKNNTTADATVTVMIYANGEFLKSNTAKGPLCMAIVSVELPCSGCVEY